MSKENNAFEEFFEEKIKQRIFSVKTNCDKELPALKFKFGTPDRKRYEQIHLHEVKELISVFKKNEWDYHRDIINPYEFNNIDKINYINRAYFKLHEMIKIFDINKDLRNEVNINYTGVCEFPCGFVKCVMDNDDIYNNIETINVISNDENKPKLDNLSKVNINVLDITIKNELKECLKDKAHKSIFVTSDGGINENEDYSKKEELHYKLKLYEIGASLRILKTGGIMIIKFFDFFTTPTIEMIYYLTFFFKEIYIYKPLTSRPTNSERYIICKYKVNRECNLALNIPDKCLDNLTSFLDTNIPLDFYNNLKKINNNILNNQVNNIKFVISKIESQSFDKEKQYFKTKKSREQKKFFKLFNIKNLY